MSLYTILNHDLELVPSFTLHSLNTASNLNTTHHLNPTRDIKKSTFPGVILDGAGEAGELIKEQLSSSIPTVELPEAEGTFLDFLFELF